MRRGYSLRYLQYSWERLLKNTLGEDNLLSVLLQIAGPLAIGCGLLLLSPVLLVLTVLGAVMMKGNPFFLQPRPGKKGKDGKEKIFKLIKPILKQVMVKEKVKY